MRLITVFFATPAPPPVADRPDDGLPALVYGHSLHISTLLALGAIPLQPLDLSDIGTGETVQRLLVRLNIFPLL
jgi:hypothetical protein